MLLTGDAAAVENKILWFMKNTSPDRYTYETKEWDIISIMENKKCTVRDVRKELKRMCKEGMLRRMERDKWTVTYYIISPKHAH